MATYWSGRTVLVTGGAGFLGRRVVARLQVLDCGRIDVPRSARYDLVDRQAVRQLLADTRPQIVLHLAARVGGIGANQMQPGRYFHDNLVMGVNIIEESRQAGVEKLLVVGTVCAYPKFAPLPFREDDLWNGYPEETNAPYGIAKKALLVQLQAYRQQYGFPGIYLLPANLYGPGDNFDLRTSHVIPALIRKCIDAREEGAPAVEVWGSGEATREFLYVDDCAEAILLAAEHYHDAAPINVGTGREIRIRELVVLIARLTGYGGGVAFDRSKPDGQPRRVLDVSRARAAFGFQARVRLEDGLRQTIEWFLAHRAEVMASTPPSPGGGAHG